MLFVPVCMFLFHVVKGDTSMDVNLTIFSTEHNDLGGDGLWLFCVADKPVRDVDWYQNGVRLDDSDETRQSDFECPTTVTTSVRETCEVSGFINGFQLYVPDKYIHYTDNWSCLAEPETGYPMLTAPKSYEIEVCETEEIDLVLLLDGSGSVGNRNFQKMLQFVKEFLWFADIDTGRWRVGVLRYDSSSSVQFQLNTYSTKTDILNAVGSIHYPAGSTHTASGLEEMHLRMFTVANGDRREVPNTAILLTDGLSNVNAHRTIPEADNAKQKNITIYTISINLNDQSEVKQIASVPYSKYGYVINSFNEIESAAEKLFIGIFEDMLCEKSLPNLTPTSNSSKTSQCQCATSVPGPEISKEDLDKRVEERRKRIIIDKSNTTLNKEKYASASDNRTSAVVIGYVSIAILSLLFLGILMLDCIDICRDRRQSKNS